MFVHDSLNSLLVGRLFRSGRRPLRPGARDADSDGLGTRVLLGVHLLGDELAGEIAGLPLEAG